MNTREKNNKNSFYKFENGELKVFTKDGYIRVVPKNEDGHPGVYVDLVSNKVSDENACIDEKGIAMLAMIEEDNDEDNENSLAYRTIIWGDCENEDATDIINHRIISKGVLE